MLKKLDKRNNTLDTGFEPKEGERTLLSSNKGGMRSPSLDLGIHPESTEDELIVILANILAEGFINQYGYGKQQELKGSDILPGVNKRTG